MFGNTLSELAELFNALSNEFRLEIVRRLVTEEEVACERLAEELPLSRPALSHHVRILKQNRIIKVTKRGQFLFYRLNREYLTQLSPDFVEYIQREAKKWQR